MLTALLAESEGVEEAQGSHEQADDLDGLFDADNDEEFEEGIEKEGPDVGTVEAMSDLFGEVDDIENEEKYAERKESVGEACKSLNRSKEDLQGTCR